MWETSMTLAIGQRAIVTLAGPRRTFPALLRWLDGATVRRRLFRHATSMLSRTPLLGLLLDRDGEPPAPALVDLLAAADEMVPGERAEAMALVHVSAWPGRSYAVALDRAGRPRFFAKVSTTPFDAVRFAHEHEMLASLWSVPLAAWRTPRSHGIVTGEGVAALVTECLPSGAANLDGRDVLRRVPLHRIGAPATDVGDPLQLDWMRNALDQPLGPTFRALVDEALSEPVRVGLAHADLTVRNAFAVEDSKPWLLDWEVGALNAPAGTDVVCGEMQIGIGDRDVSATATWRRLLGLASTHDISAQQLTLAVLFLASRGTRHARCIATTPESLRT